MALFNPFDMSSYAQQNEGAIAAGLQALQNRGMGNVAGIQAGAQQGVANTQAQASMKNTQTEANTQGLLGALQAQTGLQQTGLQTGAATQQAQIAAEASKYPYQLRSQQFNQLFPLFQQGINSLTNAAGQGAVSGQANTTGMPKINAAPVYNAQTIQRQVNQGNAQQDASTATQQRLNTQQNAGRGYSSNSPLLQMMNQSAQMSGNATKAQNEQALRYNTAQGNSQQLLSGQQAQEGQYASRQQEALQRQQNILNYQSSLYNALGNAMA